MVPEEVHIIVKDHVSAHADESIVDDPFYINVPNRPAQPVYVNTSMVETTAASRLELLSPVPSSVSSAVPTTAVTPVAASTALATPSTNENPYDFNRPRNVNTGLAAPVVAASLLATELALLPEKNEKIEHNQSTPSAQPSLSSVSLGMTKDSVDSSAISSSSQFDFHTPTNFSEHTYNNVSELRCEGQDSGKFFTPHQPTANCADSSLLSNEGPYIFKTPANTLRTPEAGHIESNALYLKASMSAPASDTVPEHSVLATVSRDQQDDDANEFPGFLEEDTETQAAVAEEIHKESPYQFSYPRNMDTVAAATDDEPSYMNVPQRTVMQSSTSGAYMNVPAPQTYEGKYRQPVPNRTKSGNAEEVCEKDTQSFVSQGDRDTTLADYVNVIRPMMAVSSPKSAILGDLEAAQSL